MQEKKFKYRLKLTKYGELKFISHLDWQNLIIKSIRRTGVGLVLTEGFNKIPKMGFSPALPIFIESECELVYFQTYEPIAKDFKEKFENNTNKNVKIVECIDFSDLETKLPPLDTLIQWAKYEAVPLCNKNESILNSKEIMYNVENCLSLDELLIEKKTKKGLTKVINYRNSLKSAQVNGNKITFVLKTGQNADIAALRADEFLKKLFGEKCLFDIKRVCFFDSEMKVL